MRRVLARPSVPCFPSWNRSRWRASARQLLLVIPSLDAAGAAWPHQNWPHRGTIRPSRKTPADVLCIRLAKHLHGHGGRTSQGCQVYPCALAAWTAACNVVFPITNLPSRPSRMPRPARDWPSPSSHPTGRIQLGSTLSSCPDAALVQPRPSATSRAPLGTASAEYRGFVGGQVACCGRPKWRQYVFSLLLQTIAGPSISRPLFFSSSGPVPRVTRAPGSRETRAQTCPGVLMPRPLVSWHHIEAWSRASQVRGTLLFIGSSPNGTMYCTRQRAESEVKIAQYGAGRRVEKGSAGRRIATLGPVRNALKQPSSKLPLVTEARFGAECPHARAGHRAVSVASASFASTATLTLAAEPVGPSYASLVGREA